MAKLLGLIGVLQRSRSHREHIHQLAISGELRQVIRDYNSSPGTQRTNLACFIAAMSMARRLSSPSAVPFNRS